MEKRIIPKFATEAEEAQWWYDNREEIGKDFAQALAEGRLRRRIGPRTSAPVPTTTIRLDPADIELARAQAEKKGLKYQRPTSRCFSTKLYSKRNSKQHNREPRSPSQRNYSRKGSP